jgi:hypothetical protein
MAYTINKTNGEVLTTLIDGQVDTTTDLTLIGKNYTGYGEQLNENFIKLLENFSGTAEPSRPILGQLWYDTTSARVMVYGITGWKAAGGPIVTSTQPLNFTTGDIWIDNDENQMWFFDGSDLILAGQIWKRTQGKTGFVAETLFDNNNNPKPVLLLYVKDSLLGIFSSEQFTPVPTLSGFTELKKGYNANSLIASTFYTTVSNAQTLTNLTASQFMRSDISTTNGAKILIQHNDGLTIGANQVADFKISGTTALIENVISGADISLRINNNTGTYDAVYVDSSTNRVGIFTASPQQTMDINGTLRVRGDFIVEGDTVNVAVSTLTVEDKNIEIAYTGDSSLSTDAAANGAGIIIKGTSDKTLIYNNVTKAFDISENINIASGKVFRIGGVEVLSENTLSAVITSAPGITTIGPQVSLTVDDIYINNNRISNLVVNQDIEIEPLGTGNLALIGNPRITGLADPVSDQDASTKSYTEVFAKLAPISLTLIENGLSGAINSNCVLLLNDVANPVLYIPGKYAFIHIQAIDNSVIPATITRSLKRFIIKNTGSSNFWDFDSDLTSSI